MKEISTAVAARGDVEIAVNSLRMELSVGSIESQPTGMFGKYHFRIGVAGASRDNGETHTDPCGSGPIKTFAVVGQAFRIRSDFTDFGKVGAYTNCPREIRGSAKLRYKYRATAFGSVLIV